MIAYALAVDANGSAFHWVPLNGQTVSVDTKGSGLLGKWVGGWEERLWLDSLERTIVVVSGRVRDASLSDASLEMLVRFWSTHE